MSEADVIRRTRRPVTASSLCRDLESLGVKAGTTLLVHSSLSALGWVCGGPAVVVHALLTTLGADGTLVMPSHTSHLSDPSYWHNPPVPSEWWNDVRENLPPFDPNTTPSRYVGCVAETMRAVPGSRRSQHPQYSFVALGRRAIEITDNHSLHFGLGNGSPLARLYDLGGSVLLLGVGFDRNTSLHLAEHRMEVSVGKPLVNGAPVLRNGKREWVEIKDRELHDGDFNKLGEQCQRMAWLRKGSVGQAVAYLMPQRELVDFARGWFEKHR